jgi:hypothetical protein
MELDVRRVRHTGDTAGSGRYRMSEQAEAAEQPAADTPAARAKQLGRFLLISGLILAAVIVVGRWVPAGPRLPTRAEVESRLAGDIGLREHTSVTVTCDEPDENGVSCRLRDGAGRYGYSITTFDRESGYSADAPVRLIQTTTWDFPIDSGGILAEDLNTTPPWDVQSRISAVVLLAGGALGPYDPDARADCPDVTTAGAPVPCTVSGQIRAGTLQWRAPNRYRLTLTYRLPSTEPTHPPR